MTGVSEKGKKRNMGICEAILKLSSKMESSRSFCDHQGHSVTVQASGQTGDCMETVGVRGNVLKMLNYGLSHAYAN